GSPIGAAGAGGGGGVRWPRVCAIAPAGRASKRTAAEAFKNLIWSFIPLTRSLDDGRWTLADRRSPILSPLDFPPLTHRLLTAYGIAFPSQHRPHDAGAVAHFHRRLGPGRLPAAAAGHGRSGACRRRPHHRRQVDI